jgi:hypothetical protein
MRWAEQGGSIREACGTSQAIFTCLSPISVILLDSDGIALTE